VAEQLSDKWETIWKEGVVA